MLRAIFAALLLALGLSFTASAAIKTGVTVLVHGFVALDDPLFGTTPYDYWGGRNGTNLTELLERFGSGLVWEYDPATGNYVNITHSETPTGRRRIPEGDWAPAFAGQQILLFDWTAGSDERESGQAEAAADALFASLMKFEVNGEPIISRSPYAAARPLHFIGHSRGTVVVSETVQRLGRFNIRVNYVTYLDIHDFGQPGIARDEYFHDPAVQVWENIDYVDAVYQRNPANMCTVNPAGRPLNLSRTLERNVTSLTGLDTTEECRAHQRPHAWVKEYYWATVAAGAFLANADRPPRWFDENNGVGSVRGFGFDRWFSNGGFEQAPEPLLNTNRVRCVVAGDADPYYWNPFDENGALDRNDVPPVLFNGNFDLPDLDRGIGKTLAGWHFFGGGVSAHVGSNGSNFYLDLGGNNALVATHNRFFLPPEARELLFAIHIRFVPFTAFDEYLEVRIGPDVVRRFSIEQVTADFVPWRVEAHQLTRRGGVNTLTFELVTALLGESPRVHIDNISFVTEPTAWIHSFNRLDEANWRLIWRSWPSATFHLQSSSNLLNWATIRTSSGAGNSGSFNIPEIAGPRVFYRGWADPER